MSKAKIPFRLQPKGAELIIKAWPVEVNVPTDGGVFEEQTLDVDFLVLDNDQMQTEFGGELALYTDKDAMDRFLKRVVRGFPNLTQESAEERALAKIEFTDELRDSVLAMGNVRNAVITAYLLMINGRAEKNSVRRPA